MYLNRKTSLGLQKEDEQVVRTPKCWENKEVFGELTEVKTAYGNTVKIPKIYLNGWETENLTKEAMEKRGLDPLDGLETLKDGHPMSYDLVRVFYEIYQDED